MKTHSTPRRPGAAGFTVVEVMISMTIVVMVLGMTMSTFLFGLRTMYKDTQRLATNASLRGFMAQISKETLDASFFYLFPYYTKLDGNIDLTADFAALAQTADFTDNDYDKWVGHGDCLVLVTKTSQFRQSDIKQVRIYYRLTTTQTTRNSESTLRYYETADWGEGTSSTSNGHPLDGPNPLDGLVTALNAINLSSTPLLSGSKQLNARSKGRAVPSPFTGYTSGDLYPVFSSESPSNNPSMGFISINVEFINGSSIVNNMLSSSSFNYTISPRR